MTVLITQTALSGLAASTVLRSLLEHLVEHDFVAVQAEHGWTLDYEGAQILFHADGDTLSVQVQAPTQETLFDARMMIHHHLAEFAACEPEFIRWEGDSPQFERPPAFRILTVVSAQQVSPHLRRIRFHSENLARYQSDEDFHCKLLIPRPGNADPEWPTMGTDGLPRLPSGDKQLDMRTYTIRRIDASASWLEIDFVLHEDAGPGSAWAVQAQAGQQIGISGPGGRTARPAEWMLLAADETGLPAVARILEGLSAGTRGKVILEVQAASDAIPLNVPEGMDLSWIYRNEATPGTGRQLVDAIRACTIPEGDRFVWVAGEFSMVQEVRTWLRQDCGLTGKEQLVVAYWRLGMDETRMKSGGRRSEREPGESQTEEARAADDQAGNTPE
ncbi:MAG TPA: siderophore-interacting protein [Burkholderiaceae bacterium]|nr:siderophore-interacting protein [Burkholderiaceae bacterium]